MFNDLRVTLQTMYPGTCAGKWHSTPCSGAGVGTKNAPAPNKATPAPNAAEPAPNKATPAPNDAGPAPDKD